VDGVLWVYVDENNRPARLSCVEAQLVFFAYDYELLIVDFASEYAVVP
jgi:hypothetical protein